MNLLKKLTRSSSQEEREKEAKHSSHHETKLTEITKTTTTEVPVPVVDQKTVTLVAPTKSAGDAQTAVLAEAAAAQASARAQAQGHALNAAEEVGFFLFFFLF